MANKNHKQSACGVAIVTQDTSGFKSPSRAAALNSVQADIIDRG
jgi:hypothetical protein